MQAEKPGIIRCAFSSPLGDLQLEVEDDYLTAIHYSSSEDATSGPPDHPVLKETINQLTAYFDQKCQEFDLPLNTKGTDFQQKVWQALSEIPYGQTTTYGELAQMLGDKKKVRAVGRANGQNPIPIIIPCHRVIGADGKLVGYSGGLANKKWLLRHEGALLL